MAIRRSTALINKLAQGYGVRELLRDGRIYVYSGSQPASADTAPTGTLLCTFTLAGGTYTSPVQSKATLTVGGTATGTISAIKVGGMAYNLLESAVDWASSNAATANAVVAAVNARQNPLNITAEANSADVVLKAPYWLGALADGLTTTANATGSATITASANFANGTTAANGLNFLEAIVDGVLSKESGTWQAVAAAGGTAGWFRFVAGGSTVDGVADEDIRFDGNVATSGGDMTISSTSISANATYTISAGTITEPAE